jgi:hypothetical protein
VRIIGLVVIVFLGGCVNLDTICPHKTITQGVFGEIADSTGANEQNVEVTIFSDVNGAQGNMFGDVETTRGGYQFMAGASTYFLCAKTVCTMVVVPTGIVEESAVDEGSAADAASGLTWDAPVAVPPDQMIGPCKFGD